MRGCHPKAMVIFPKGTDHNLWGKGGNFYAYQCRAHIKKSLETLTLCHAISMLNFSFSFIGQKVGQFLCLNSFKTTFCMKMPSTLPHLPASSSNISPQVQRDLARCPAQEQIPFTLI